MAKSGELGRLYAETTCGALLAAKARRGIFELPAHTSVAEASRALAARGVSAAPVYEERGGEKTYVGMLDYRDIAKYVVQFAEAEGDDGWSPEQLEDAGTVADMSRWNPFLAVRAEDALAEALRVLAGGGRAHRVCVVSDGRLVGVLSQTDIVRHAESLARTKGSAALARLFGCPLRALGLGSREDFDGVTLGADECALDALARMCSRGVSSAPVLGGPGDASAVLGNISLTDVRLALVPGEWERLWLPCGQLVALALRERAMAADGRDSFPVFEVTRDAPLARAVQKMLATGVHRVWVVAPGRGSAPRLVGVVSMSDVVRLLYAALRDESSA